MLQNNLEKYPGIQVTIDVHRDSMTTEEGVKYKPTAVINGRKAAQIMFLAGSDANGDWGDFPDWRDNLHLALRVQQTASELYPELVRPLDFSDSKYNMNATKGSLLVEVGTEVNTASEARYSGETGGGNFSKNPEKTVIWNLSNFECGFKKDGLGGRIKAKGRKGRDWMKRQNRGAWRVFFFSFAAALCLFILGIGFVLVDYQGRKLSFGDDQAALSGWWSIRTGQRT